MFKRTVFAIALLASAIPICAFAESDAERQACTNDAQTLCPDEIPDRGRVYACLVEKVAQLSPACKKIITDSLAPPPNRRKR